MKVMRTRLIQGLLAVGGFGAGWLFSVFIGCDTRSSKRMIR